MAHEFRPLVVIPAVQCEEGIRFMPPVAQRWVVRSHCDIVWAILGQCDGRSNQEAVITAAQKQLPTTDRETILQVFDHLVTLGVVVDCRRAFESVIPLINNPSPYPGDLTPDEVRAHARSARLPVAEGRRFELDPGQPTGLGAIQRDRRSCRGFRADHGLYLGQLGRLLTRTYSTRLHTTPSGGGLWPLKLYVIVTTGQGKLEKGYYEYDPEEHALILYDEFDHEALQFAFGMETLLHGAPVIVVIAADLERHPKKYGNRGFLYSILEAGHAAQNFLLAATEAGVSSLEYGGFRNEALAKELRMNTNGDAGRVWPITTIAMGYPSDNPEVDPDRELERLRAALMGEDGPVEGLYTLGGTTGSEPDFVIASAKVYPATRETKTKPLAASGAGASATIARITALAEAWERYTSGRVRVDRKVQATELSASSEAWLDPRIIAPVTDAQRVNLGLEKFDPDRPWEWIEGRNTEGGVVWVPIDIVYYPWPTSKLGRARCSLATSSGVAAFTSKAEAEQRGLYELVERHALMLDWLYHEPLPRVAASELPYHWQRRAEYWTSQQRRVHIIDMSRYAVGLVAINVVIESDAYPFFMSGAAAADSFEIAVGRAFREAEKGTYYKLLHTQPDPIKPEQVTTAHDHGVLYAASARYARSLAWLWGGVETTHRPRLSATTGEVMRQVRAVTVKLSPADAPLVVMRVLSEALVPISFGYGNIYHTHQAVSGSVHPVSITDPHYFA